MNSLSSGHLKTGVNSLRSAKLRNFWSMFGVIIGVTSVITIVAIGTGVKQQITGQIHDSGKNLVIIRPNQVNSGTGSSSSVSLVSGLNTSEPLTLQDINTITHVTGIAASAPLTITSGTVSGDNGTYRDGLVIGTTSDLSSLLNQSMAYGTFLNNGDTGQNVAVIGQHVSDAMFNEDVPLGRSFTFHGQQFIVEGIFNQFTTTPLSQQADFNNAIFIPNDVAESLTNNTAPTYELLARPTNIKQIGSVVSRIQQALAQTHGGQSSFSVTAGDQGLTTSNNILGLLTRLIAGVAAISLLVSGVGIMNVMLVSVVEREHEIGIRKAVGATNRQILAQFMIESSILSVAGGIIGIVLAFLIDISLRLLTDLKPIISWQVVVLASGVSLLVGVIFGTVPAFKAARKDPIEALRGE